MRVLIDGDRRYRYIGGIAEHRLVAERALGRKLSGTELVHHLDGNKKNNTPTNLVICPDDSYHRLLHARQACLDDGYHPDKYAYCSYHNKYEPHAEFSTRRTWNGLHNMCRAATNEYRKVNGYNVNKFTWRAKMHQQTRRAVMRKLASSLVKEDKCL